MNDDPIVKESGFTISGISNEQGEGWQVVGDDIQALLAVLQQGQEVMCQPGAMVSTTGTVEPELTTGGCFNGCKRCWCAGELCCRTHYKNVNGRLEHVTVSPPYPSKIIPVSMNEHTSGLYITRQSWLASVGRDADFNVSCMPSFSQCCCLGLGYSMNLVLCERVTLASADADAASHPSWVVVILSSLEEVRL
uniref:Altered inheritance of mitochondria protein 24, mitochondrial n=1 Tax=Guillardia theta TaxID=55529 RepID=A0A7S4PIM9_GUITH